MMKKSSFSSAYIMLLTAIFVSSFVNVFSKIAAQYDFLSIPFLFFYGIAMLITVGYSVVWQLGGIVILTGVVVSQYGKV